MIAKRRNFILCGAFVGATCTSAFTQQTVAGVAAGERVAGSVAIDRALKSSCLTFEGSPFHALMEIGTTGPYSGKVELWWVSAGKYRLIVTSPDFHQVRIVNGEQVEEKNEGNYYPRWLENFVLALMNPLPMAEVFRDQSVVPDLQQMKSCLVRDDRPAGITDQMTWGEVCFTSSEFKISSVLTFNDSMQFKDWKGFEGKQIARTYETTVLDYKPVTGRLVRLEEMKTPNEALFAINSATPSSDRIATSFVSTSKEESLIESAPEIHWPTVREGKTEGYMIVYARTDRTGQVRETAKHNSDQPGLESFGMEQALRYKFKPLIVNGVAEQMEMPLVLHFSSSLADPTPVLSAIEMRKQMPSCRVGTLPAGTQKGTTVLLRVSVDEAGRLTGVASVGSGGVSRSVMAAAASLRECRFVPLKVNGKATPYKGDIEIGSH